MLERLEQQKTLTRNQWRIIATANLGDMLDFFDFFLIGYVLAFIVKYWHLTYGQSAVILLSSGLGAVPGAFFWGWMADRIGRRKVFIPTALNVAVATGIMDCTPGEEGWVPGWIFLSFFRFFVGFGNAGLIAVDIPLVQEFVPAYKRGWVSGLTTVLLPAGNILGALSGALPRADDRLARPVPGRSGAGGPGADDPLLGAGIAALADAHGPLRGSPQVARLGVAVRPGIELPRPPPRGRDDRRGANCSTIRAAWRGLPDRPEPDRRRRLAVVDHRRCSCWCCGSPRPRPPT